MLAREKQFDTIISQSSKSTTLLTQEENEPRYKLTNPSTSFSCANKALQKDHTTHSEIISIIT